MPLDFSGQAGQRHDAVWRVSAPLGNRCPKRELVIPKALAVLAANLVLLLRLVGRKAQPRTAGNCKALKKTKCRAGLAALWHCCSFRRRSPPGCTRGRRARSVQRECCGRAGKCVKIARSVWQQIAQGGRPGFDGCFSTS